MFACDGAKLAGPLLLTRLAQSASIVTSVRTTAGLGREYSSLLCGFPKV
jgi:hypothetical protein